MTEKKRGRPTIAPGEGSVPLKVHIPVTQYRRMAARSERDRKSLQSVVREGLDRLLEDEDDDEA